MEMSRHLIYCLEYQCNGKMFEQMHAKRNYVDGLSYFEDPAADLRNSKHRPTSSVAQQCSKYSKTRVL